jgi:putative hydrolase of the HAD superfamily
MEPVSHLLFDFFGTLVLYENTWVRDGFEQSYRLLRDEGATCDYAGYLAHVNDAFSSFERRAVESLEEYSMNAVCEALLASALARAPSSASIERFRDTYLAEWNRGVRYIPGVRELLQRLSQDYCLALVSNTHQADVVLAHVDALQIRSYFSAVVTSIEHGRRKPSACIFERALSSTRGKAETAIYVGDSYSADYLGATQAGLRCLLIDEKRAHPIPEEARLTSILDLARALPARTPISS